MGIGEVGLDMCVVGTMTVVYPTKVAFKTGNGSHKLDCSPSS